MCVNQGKEPYGDSHAVSLTHKGRHKCLSFLGGRVDECADACVCQRSNLGVMPQEPTSCF